MMTLSDPDSLRKASLQYLWMHNRDWRQMAKEGKPNFMVVGEGVRVVDATGKVHTKEGLS